MPIECDCCGKIIDKFDMIKYNRKWLEQYLEDYFKMSVTSLRSTGQLKKGNEILFRAVCLYVFRTYGKMSVTDIEKIYGINSSRIGVYIHGLDKSHHDFVFIDKELSAQLPPTERLITHTKQYNHNEQKNGHGH